MEQAVDVTRIVCQDGSLQAARERFVRFRCGVFMVCTGGECVISTGVTSFEMKCRAGLLFVTGTIVCLVRCSDDFRVRMLLFPKERFLNAVMPLDTALFNFMHSNPLYVYPDADADDTRNATDSRAWKGVCLWLDMAEMLFGSNPRVTDSASDLVVQEEHDFLQGLFLWMRRSLNVDTAAREDEKGRMRSLCHRFLGLVHEYAATEHGVNFYAGKLCISPRYLNRITSMYVDGLSPKKIIDDQLVAEIKVRLCDPSLSITEIAADLNFSDQTYMSTFFRRLTGISPVEYRRSVIG